MTLRSLFAPGIAAVRADWRSFVAIQILAAALVTAYYLLPGFPAAMAWVAEAKNAGGFAASALLTVLASVALPEGLRALTGKPRSPRRMILFRIAFFALIGVAIDLLYVILAALFGNGTDLATILKKVAVDQFVSTPFITIPFSVTAFLWAEKGFTLAGLRSGLPEWPRRWATLLVIAWSFWLPVLAFVFAMPRDLQFPLFVVIQAAWSLLLVAVSKAEPV